MEYHALSGGQVWSSPAMYFTYNEEGIRTSKTDMGLTKHYFDLSGSQIISEYWYESGVERRMVFLYDEAGAPIGLKYRTGNYAANEYDCYFFEKNLQGDIIAIYNEARTLARAADVAPSSPCRGSQQKSRSPSGGLLLYLCLQAHTTPSSTGGEKML